MKQEELEQELPNMPKWKLISEQRKMELEIGNVREKYSLEVGYREDRLAQINKEINKREGRKQ